MKAREEQVLEVVEADRFDLQHVIDVCWSRALVTKQTQNYNQAITAR